MIFYMYFKFYWILSQEKDPVFLLRKQENTTIGPRILEIRDYVW